MMSNASAAPDRLLQRLIILLPQKRLILAAGILLSLLTCGLGRAQEGDLERVRFIPQWLPQAQFAGYYVAHDKGFFRRQGIEVQILRGGPDRPVSETLGRKEADIGTMFLATGIVKRAAGGKLAHLSQIVQRSAMMLVARRSQGINSPQDMQGKKVGLWGEEFRLRQLAFLRQFGLTVQIVPQNNTMNLFLRGGVEVASAMWYNEYHLLLAAGLNPEELTVFPLAEYGLNFPEDALFGRDDFVRAHPGLCRRFVDAVLEGWEYAFTHPEEALDIVMNYVEAAKCATNRVHQRWMLARMQDIIVPGGGLRPTGQLQETDYLLVAQELKNNGLIDHIPSFGDFAPLGLTAP